MPKELLDRVHLRWQRQRLEKVATGHSNTLTPAIHQPDNYLIVFRCTVELLNLWMP